MKRKITYEEFEYLVYSRLHYFGEYYYDSYDGTEYMSCYDRDMTQKILAERQKPENAVFDYPDFEKLYSSKKQEIPKALENWNEYVKWNLNIDWQTAENLLMQVPAMAASGVIKQKEIVAVYKEMIRGTGSRVTKKAENLIDGLCLGMPLATKKGNAGSEGYEPEKGELHEAVKLKKMKGASGEAVKPKKMKGASGEAVKPKKMKGASSEAVKPKKMKGASGETTKSEKTEDGKGKKHLQDEYIQLSIFNL